MADKLTDEQILQMISEFEALKEEEKSKRFLGKGMDKLVYDVPGHDMVMKVPNTTGEYGNTSLENDYIYSKQLNKHIPVETPILVKRPESSDVLLQRKLNPLGPEETITDEFMNSIYDKYPDTESRKQALKVERNRINATPSNVAEMDYYKAFDKAGLEDGDIHRGNLAFDKSGTTKAMDVSKFWTNDATKNDALHKMRETFSDKMDKLGKTRIFRQVAGALPLAGTAMALSSGNAEAAANELPSEIPGIGQVYDAVRSDSAGSASDDREMINEVNARNNYGKSQARADALAKMKQKP